MNEKRKFGNEMDVYYIKTRRNKTKKIKNNKINQIMLDFDMKQFLIRESCNGIMNVCDQYSIKYQ